MSRFKSGHAYYILDDRNRPIIPVAYKYQACIAVHRTNEDSVRYKMYPVNKIAKHPTYNSIAEVKRNSHNEIIDFSNGLHCDSDYEVMR